MTPEQLRQRNPPDDVQEFIKEFMRGCGHEWPPAPAPEPTLWQRIKRWFK